MPESDSDPAKLHDAEGRRSRDLGRLRAYNLSLANENHELWQELCRLRSPLWAEKEARMAEIFREAKQQYPRSAEGNPEADKA